MRDDEWLNIRMNQLWELLFPDLEKKNKVFAIFKGKWKNKFGHIKYTKNKETEIAINGLLKHEIIPEYMIDITLAHEIVHYAHGFNSPHPQKYKHPHAGGIVTRELKNKGFGFMLKKEKEFLNKRWYKLHNILTANNK